MEMEPCVARAVMVSGWLQTCFSVSLLKGVWRSQSCAVAGLRGVVSLFVRHLSGFTHPAHSSQSLSSRSEATQKPGMQGGNHAPDPKIAETKGLRSAAAEWTRGFGPNLRFALGGLVQLDTRLNYPLLPFSPQLFFHLLSFDLSPGFPSFIHPFLLFFRTHNNTPSFPFHFDFHFRPYPTSLPTTCLTNPHNAPPPHHPNPRPLPHPHQRNHQQCAAPRTAPGHRLPLQTNLRQHHLHQTASRRRRGRGLPPVRRRPPDRQQQVPAPVQQPRGACVGHVGAVSGVSDSE